MDKLNLIDFDKYTITEDGKIFSNTFNYMNHQVLGCKDRNGYHSVYLRCIDKKSRNFLKHRVIWFYFNGEIPQNYEINHIDENKANNSLCNLELLTRAENVRYGTRTERAAATNSTVQKGRKFTKEHIEKLSLAKSKPILQYDLETNEPIKEWQSSKDVEKQLGYNASTIRKVCRNIYSQAYGYGWKHLRL